MELKQILQIAGTVLGILYLILEYKANIWLWVVGLLMPTVHSILFFKAGLYADFGMQMYYVAAGIYGLAVWALAGKKKKEGEPSGPSKTPLKILPFLIAIYLALHAGLFAFLKFCTDSTVPVLDSMTTALSVIAMWMLSRKYTEQWLVWLAVDAVTFGLYIYKGISITAGLYLLYCLMAVIGYRRWRKMQGGNTIS